MKYHGEFILMGLGSLARKRLAVIGVAMSLFGIGLPSYAIALTPGPLMCWSMPAPLQSNGLPFPFAPYNQPGARSYDWVKPPDWMVGTWQTTSATIEQSYDYRSRQFTVSEPVRIAVKRSMIVGMQQDATGQVWHYIGTPYRRSFETSSYREYHNTEKMSFSQVTDDQVSVSTLAAVSKVDKQNNQVLDSFTEQTTARYTLLGDGLIRADLDVDDFDLGGNHLYSSYISSIYKRTRGFARLDRDDRGDLRRKFELFMSHP